MDYSGQLSRYLNYLDKSFEKKVSGKEHTKVDSHNANLIREFAKNYLSLPTEPSDYKALVLCQHLKSIILMTGEKHHKTITRNEIKTLINLI